MSRRRQRNLHAVVAKAYDATSRSSSLEQDGLRGITKELPTIFGDASGDALHVLTNVSRSQALNDGRQSVLPPLALFWRAGWSAICAYEPKEVVVY